MALTTDLPITNMADTTLAGTTQILLALAEDKHLKNRKRKKTKDKQE